MSNQTQEIYLLTAEYNDYDQYGEYLVAYFVGMPTVEDLMEFDMSKEYAEHVLTGGGRLNWENKWYYLRLGVPKHNYH